MQLVKLSEVKLNPNNPRLIKDDKFKKLVQSIKDFPEMLNIRPIVVNQDMIILGGNMRYKACKEAGLKEIPIIKTDLTEEQQREFLIKDNTSGGEWDWEVLANEWDVEQLEEWGLDLPNNLEEIKATKDIPDIGEIEFSEELLLEHNYIVLYFDNPMDWEVAQEIYGLKQVKSKDSSDKTKKIGIGRVINGKNFI
jgi:ParB-like chromosome segregation protein Spo0J